MRKILVLFGLVLVLGGDSPGARLHDRQFWRALRGVTSLRIEDNCRVGGVDTDPTVDVVDADGVREFLGLFRFEDAASCRACPCHNLHAYAIVCLKFDGTRSTELELNRDLAVGGVSWDASVSGESEDRQANLTIDSARDIERWLSMHHMSRIADRLKDDIAGAVDVRDCTNRAAELLPADVLAELNAVVGDCDAGKNEAEILRRHVPDNDVRTTLALRLIAAKRYAAGARFVLDHLSAKRLAEVLRSARADAETAYGADRYVVDVERRPRVHPEILDEFLRPAAERRLASAGHRDRDLAIYALRDVEHPEAVALLRTLLEAPAPYDQQRAAEILVYSKEDEASFERIRELAQTFRERDRELLLERMACIEERQR